ncbi:MAG: methyltransferase [Pseudomonadota bacterium]
MAHVPSDDYHPPSDFGLKKPGLIEKLQNRFRDWRNRKVMDPAFQAFATGFPLTRPIVRKRQKALFDLTAGFVYSQVLFSAVRLGVFDCLRDGALSEAALYRRIGLSNDAGRRLIAAAASLDLLSVKGDEVRLADLGAALLANPGVVAMIEHHAMLYRDLADPIGLLKGERDTELSEFWGYATAERPDALKRDRVDDYSALMAISQKMISAEVIAAYPFAGHKRLLDVGGGEGAFVSAVADAVPKLELSVFDLPSVAERAREKMAEAGHGNRFTAFPGSFFDDELPAGADLISLVRVLYDHSDERVLQILQRVRRVLPEGGTLLIAEPMAGVSGAEAMGDAYFGFYLMAMKSGQARTFAEIGALLKTAGFRQFRVLKTRSPMLTSALITNG